MISRSLHCIMLALFSLFLLASTAWGAGIFLYELGTPDLGTAGAGLAATAKDASTAFNNPAGMTCLDRSQMLVALQGLYYDAKFKTKSSGFGGGDGGQAGGFLPAGSLHYVHQVTSDFSLGISAGSNFGLFVDYTDNWAGRYYSTESQLMTFSIDQAAAYRVNNWLSVGASFVVMYASLHQKTGINNSAVPGQAGLGDGQIKIKDDEIAYGYNLGLMLTPRDGTRFGFTYRSKLDLDFKDVASLRNISPILQKALDAAGLTGSKMDVSMTIPQTLMLSGYHQITDNWAIMANIGWQDFSEFGKQDIKLRSTTSTKFTTDLHYHDTWHGALGTHYRFLDSWLWSVGAAYDSSPVSQSTRGADMPMDKQIRIGSGIQYDLNEDMTLGAAYEYMAVGNSRIGQEGGPLDGPLKGKYTSNAIHFLALNLIVKF